MTPPSHRHTHTQTHKHTHRHTNTHTHTVFYNTTSFSLLLKRKIVATKTKTGRETFSAI